MFYWKFWAHLSPVWLKVFICKTLSGSLFFSYQNISWLFSYGIQKSRFLDKGLAIWLTGRLSTRACEKIWTCTKDWAGYLFTFAEVQYSCVLTFLCLFCLSFLMFAKWCCSPLKVLFFFCKKKWGTRINCSFVSKRHTRLTTTIFFGFTSTASLLYMPVVVALWLYWFNLRTIRSH